MGGGHLLNKAFTLIELLGVLIILAVISLITIPIIDNSLKNSRQAAYDRAVDNIINAARNYSVSNDLGYSTTKLPLFVSELQDEGFLALDIKSPIDESEMNGCVWYYWDESHKQYIFEYDNECTIEDPIINITYNADLINSNGWAKENIAVTLAGNGEIKYCISNSECEPNEIVALGNNTKFITNEGNNYLCALATNSLETTNKECINIKLDKTAPTIDGLELITVDKGEVVDLNSGVTVDDNLSGVDGTYTINPSSVDTTTAGNKNVIYSVSDLAGNTTTKNRTIKVTSEPPVIVFNVEGNPFNSNNWSKENVTVRIDVTDNSGLGIKEIKYCKGTTDCEPITTIENNGTVVLEENSTTNKVCVEAIDNNNTSSKICSNNYQIDKVLPTIDGIGDIKVNRNETVNLTSGVTYSDALSQIDGELTVTPSTVDTSTVGIKQVTYKVVDKAGNVREVVRNIIVDADAPTIVFNLVNSSAINSNGWAKSDFYLRATITDNSGTGIASGSSCTTNSSSECTPVASFTGTTKDFLISVEGSNRACVQVTDNNNRTTKVCSNTYNLDKTAPTVGTATFSGTMGSNSWYTSNVTVNKVNGSDALSGHSSTTSNISSITSNTTGQTVTITTTDLAGNSSTRNYTIKIDKNAPTLTAKSGTVEIKEGTSNPVSNYFTVSYSISGGSIRCTPTNTSSLGVGSQTLSCTATGGNGKTTIAEKEITVNPITLISILLMQYNQENTVGLIQDKSDSNIYYYKGTNEDVSNNYLWYGGHHWRVVEIDANANTLLLVSQQPLTVLHLANIVWDSRNEYENSYINNWLNDYFYNSLDDSVKNNIVSNHFNVGIYNNVDEITTIQKVGLPDYTQYTRAGGDGSYLDVKDGWWTANRYDQSSIRAFGNGLHSGTPNSLIGVRAVIKISDIAITGGNGTLTSNYFVSDRATNITDVQIGEYINVPYSGSDNACGNNNKCTFRVVSKDSDSIKVMLNGVLPNKSEYGNNATITTSHTIYTPLNTFANNISREYRYTGNKIFYIGDYPSGSNYTDIRDETLYASVGLPTVGELFSGNDIYMGDSQNYVNIISIENPTSSDNHYWLMNRQDSSSVFAVRGYNGHLYDYSPTTLRSVRPVIFLKNNLTFVSGNGTAESPYELQ